VSALSSELSRELFPFLVGESLFHPRVFLGFSPTGHDIAQDFYEYDCDTTIVQRSTTYVMSSASVTEILLAGLYSDKPGCPNTEDADLIFNSTPNYLHQVLHKQVTADIADFDKDLITGLKKAGFGFDLGIKDSGFLMKYFIRGGGYYLDVGCSRLIIEKKIKMKQGQEISHFSEDSIHFADGTSLKADVVVLATGYQNMKTTAEKVLGKEASRCNDVWGLDEQGELKVSDR